MTYRTSWRERAREREREQWGKWVMNDLIDSLMFYHYDKPIMLRKGCDMSFDFVSFWAGKLCGNELRRAIWDVHSIRWKNERRIWWVPKNSSTACNYTWQPGGCLWRCHMLCHMLAGSDKTSWYTMKSLNILVPFWYLHIIKIWTFLKSVFLFCNATQ